jgi:hypothetical protein
LVQKFSVAWYSLGENRWYTLGENAWYIMGRKMTGAFEEFAELSGLGANVSLL